MTFLTRGQAAIPLRGPAATPTGSVPVVLRSVLVPTPKLAPLTRRVNDEGLRARIVHAPETANDKARVLADISFTGKLVPGTIRI